MLRRRWFALALAAAGCSSGHDRGGTATSAPASDARTGPPDAAPPDARPWGHVTLAQLLAIGDPRPAFETELSIVGLDLATAARRAGVPAHEEERCSGDFGSMRPCERWTSYDFAITGLADGKPIPVDPSGDDVVIGFRLSLPASDVPVDAVMAGLRAKYGRPDHYSHDGLGVVWTRERVTEAVVSTDGVAIDVSRPEDVDPDLWRMESDATGSRACDRFVATFDAHLACAALPLAERIAASEVFRATEPLWQALHFHAIVGDGQDHSHDGDGFVPAAADVAAAKAGCEQARRPLATALARAGCRAPR